MNILDAFNHIEGLELRLAKLYLHFKGSFLDDAEAADMFEKLSYDEKSHYDLVQYQRRIVRREQEIFKDVDIDVREIRAIASMIDSAVKRNPPFSLGEAVKIALDIESTAGEAHYRTAMEQSNRELSDFLRHLGTSDNEHFSTLQEFAKSRSFLK
jgi:rubrerythrin